MEGGSGLYLRAALGDLAFGGAPDAARRRALEERWEREPEALVAELRRRAPDVAARVDVRNGRRVVRALESLDDEAAGRPQTDELLERRRPLRAPARRARARRRPRRAQGAHRPARGRDAGRRRARGGRGRARAPGPFSRTAAQAIGVRELCAVLDGELALPEAAARMKARTRALARRQLTWMRKLPDAARVPASGRPPAAVAADVLRLVRGGSW